MRKGIQYSVTKVIKYSDPLPFIVDGFFLTVTNMTGK